MHHSEPLCSGAVKHASQRQQHIFSSLLVLKSDDSYFTCKLDVQQMLK